MQEKKYKIMALDIGKRRIGVSVSDMLLVSAQPRENIEYTDEGSVIEDILGLVEKDGISEIVVGLPINMNGTKSEYTQFVLDFVESLKKHSHIPIKLWDERLTTKQAAEVLSKGRVSRKKKRSRLDGVAAQIILQSYLNAKNSQKS